jgi:hypothetical protein
MKPVTKLSSLNESGQYLLTPATYALQKIDGQVSIDRRKTIIEEGLQVGDYVEIVKLPDGRFILSKAESGLQIRKIALAYIQFDGKVNIEVI